MADEPIKGATPNEPPVEPGNEPPATGDQWTVEQALEELRKTRDEAKRHRLKLRELEEKVEAERRKQLEEQQKYRELYEQTKQELEAVKPKATAWEEFKERQKAELIEKLPEDKREKYANMDAETVMQVLPDILAAMQTTAPPQNPDPGRPDLKRSGVDWDKLTPQEKMTLGRRMRK